MFQKPDPKDLRPVSHSELSVDGKKDALDKFRKFAKQTSRAHPRTVDLVRELN